MSVFQCRCGGKKSCKLCKGSGYVQKDYSRDPVTRLITPRNRPARPSVQSQTKVGHFVVYHSTERMGYKLKPPGKGAVFLTNKSWKFLEGVRGHKVWMITGDKGDDNKNRYHLVGCFVVDQLGRSKDPNFSYWIGGKQGKCLRPPVELNGFDWFWTLFKSQGSFAFGLSGIKNREIVSALETLMKKAA